jgi:NAD(P)H-flavin reductase/Fe-S-cluster-containing hydrogenase component 2
MVMPATTASAAGFLPRQDFDRLLRALSDDGRQLIGPRVGDGTLELGEIDGAADLPAGIGLETAAGSARLVDRGDEKLFSYPTLAGSWKRWTFPPRAGIGRWVVDDDGTVRFEAEDAAPSPPRAFVGVRACDIAAMRIHQKAVGAGGDANLIVAVECALAGSTCFCTSMGTGPELSDGYDIALSELDDGFVVRAGSTAGASVVDSLDLPPAGAGQTEAATAQVASVRQSMGTPLPMEGLPDRLIGQPNHPRWADVAERCLACGNCTLVCPTCFCTSYVQQSDLAGGSAKTERVWDSCFTADFARVAGGNFRSRPQDRYRQWLTHKFGTWWSQFGSSGCVGCGRCIAWCPVGIDVREEVMAIAGPTATTNPPAVIPLMPPTKRAAAASGPDGNWNPAVVVSTHQETSDVVTLRLATDDSGLLAGRPGQFAMVALPGLATPAISVSRFHEDGIELTIRAVGAASAALTRLERGALVSLRGPLGRGWPVELAFGRDVQIVTGGVGLAPLRSLIDALLANRDRIGVVHLAYGARTPADRLYRHELDQLAAGGDIEIAQTVDRAGPEWLGRVGVVTQVIDRVMCACDRTVAFVCGPERMMAATADVMRERGVPDERIFVTLERHMDCGVGLCGHCQLGRFFVCRDGPVFSLAELGGALGQEGL